MTFSYSSIYKKLSSIEHDCHEALFHRLSGKVTSLPQRDVVVLPPKLHPPKKGLSEAEGQGRLLHDLANIELQAMELGLRTLIEFPEAPLEFREQLLKITLEESIHLKYCLESLEAIGHKWGDWPIHLDLWNATSPNDSLLDRILIVHRYLEGSGLDASDKILRRLAGIDAKHLQKPIETIAKDEVRHVKFGSFWYQKICKSQKLDSDKDFNERMHKLKLKIPRRLEKINPDLRKSVGFTESEIQTVEDIRKFWMRN